MNRDKTVEWVLSCIANVGEIAEITQKDTSADSSRFDRKDALYEAFLTRWAIAVAPAIQNMESNEAVEVVHDESVGESYVRVRVGTISGGGDSGSVMVSDVLALALAGELAIGDWEEYCFDDFLDDAAFPYGTNNYPYTSGSVYLVFSVGEDGWIRMHFECDSLMEFSDYTPDTLVTSLSIPPLSDVSFSGGQNAVELYPLNLDVADSDIPGALWDSVRSALTMPENEISKSLAVLFGEFEHCVRDLVSEPFDAFQVVIDEHDDGSRDFCLYGMVAETQQESNTWPKKATFLASSKVALSE